jgi:threonine dehydratase
MLSVPPKFLLILRLTGTKLTYPSMQGYLKRILTARVYDVAIESPLEAAPNLSARSGNTILLKREDMQPVFSFKLRGAYNKMAHLSQEQLRRGVIAASAGNHAQGVALSASRLGCKATIVMPTTTPQLKIDAVKHFGQRAVEIVLQGDSYSDAYQHALVLEKKHGLTFVHPFDDPDVIAGQGTIAMEILRQHQAPIHAIFCAIGGGGLVAGVAAYVKQVRPDIKVIGVQTTDSDAMARSLMARKRVTLDDVGLFSDGTAVKLAGQETFRVCKQYVDEVVLVDTDAVCAAIKDVFQDTRSILEPAGALAVAGAKLYAGREKLRGETLVTVCSGANMNFDRLRFVSERAEIGEKREAILAVTIPEMPGSFREFCSLLGNRNITEFNYRYSDPAAAQVFVGVQVRDPSETARLVASLKRKKLHTLDLTDNEMAKLHVRHMVGGRAQGVRDEIMFRFEFPERPGALMNFLNRMNHSWNISLFHYRNHGADYGRVLVGMQVPHHDKKALKSFLDKLGYRYWDESDNPAYRLFLG